MLSTEERLCRRDKVVTAAIRAGYAWAAFDAEKDAWQELARMAGVVMNACGPAQGPRTSSTLISSLSRPLRQMAPGLFEDDPVGDLTVCSPDTSDDGVQLSDDVFEYGCEHIVDLLEGEAGYRHNGWMPSWAWMRAEMVENRAFQTLDQGTTDQEYTAHRRFVIENPAGVRQRLAADFSDVRGDKRQVRYGLIPPERTFEGAFWWPCPVCRWPMRVQDTEVHCQYAPHNAFYYIRAARQRGTPMLQPRDGAVPRQPKTQRFRSEGPDQTVCVEEGVWRYIVVPGISEVRLFDRLARLDSRGVEVDLWPSKDTYDLTVRIPALGWMKHLDLKDVTHAKHLAERIAAKPPAAPTLVIPDHRGEAQRRKLDDLLNPRHRYEVIMADDVLKEVRRRLRKVKNA
ncbi:hypothetical protein IDM40_00785 [Nocardiopsis sp. HNM0947]|uniref:REase associating with pPIWI RE domain-containing protein n=1 Tax=Nocardiopsis coralli TaxID=2772213 RepID=A0ABR9P074_9ACTN|nr:hypothetical protein [Nocardiopsis coralli]MBE2997241.1 hypothetical protein [Nocardiopsis coralli]